MNGYIDAELADFLIQQNTLIDIIPQFTQDKLLFISGTFGPFKINQQVTVPLWVALYLKKTNKCRIIQPEWLRVEVLKDVYQKQQLEDELFQLPQNYYEIAKLLFANCSDDIQNDAELKLIVEDLCRSRESKVQKQMEKFMESKMEATKFNNISQNERNLAQMSSLSFLREMREKIQEASI